ncbi:hypothetical protein LCGC14_1473340 [marine sediment metagenome]|uniref:Uncharacterized protein n=1 Tax=marine sediment metagenome TaxID=412755 RepID=A0A0F9JCC7_9ZZZZ
MRAYYFGNMYLSSIQQGIQAAHATHGLFNKYAASEKAETLFNWSQNHKTMILLNGGYSENLRKIIALFGHNENPYPWAFFNESEEAADGLLTSVGIVLPEKIYVTAAAMKGDEDFVSRLRETGSWNPCDDEHYEISKYEFDLCLELNKYGLAS